MIGPLEGLTLTQVIHFLFQGGLMQYILSNFPLSPSINSSLRPLKGTGRLVKTKDITIWEKKVLIWRLRNGAILQDIFDKLQEYDGPIQIDFCFVFHKPRIIKKDGGIKIGRNDSNNFVKNSLDALCKLIGIDDSRVNSHYITRAVCENEADQQTLIRVRTCSIQVFDKQNDSEGYFL